MEEVIFFSPTQLEFCSLICFVKKLANLIVSLSLECLILSLICFQARCLFLNYNCHLVLEHYRYMCMPYVMFDLEMYCCKYRRHKNIFSKLVYIVVMFKCTVVWKPTALYLVSSLCCCCLYAKTAVLVITFTLV